MKHSPASTCVVEDEVLGTLTDKELFQEHCARLGSVVDEWLESGRSLSGIIMK